MSTCPTNAPIHGLNTYVPSSLSHPSTACELGHIQKLLNIIDSKENVCVGVH